MGNASTGYMYNEISFHHKEKWNYGNFRKWMELENIKLTEVSQAQEDKYHFLCPMWVSDSNFHICMFMWEWVWVEVKKWEKEHEIQGRGPSEEWRGQQRTGVWKQKGTVVVGGYNKDGAGQYEDGERGGWRWEQWKGSPKVCKKMPQVTSYLDAN